MHISNGWVGHFENAFSFLGETGECIENLTRPQDKTFGKRTGYSRIAKKIFCNKLKTHWHAWWIAGQNICVSGDFNDWADAVG